MCGRYTLYSSLEEIIEAFGVTEYYNYFPSYNIAPSQYVPVVIEVHNKGRCMISMRWGLIPFWQKRANINSSMINARCETLTVKPAFKAAIKYRRCLIIANGFYEWQRQDGKKQPYYITSKSNNLFAMAGIWEKWQDGEDLIESCSIITLDANSSLQNIHNRMPAIVSPANYSAWLDPAIHEAASIINLISQYDIPALSFYPVSNKVNRPDNNSVACIIEAT